MKSLRPYVFLFLIALVFRVVTALLLTQAGYMDASYTIHVATQLARGQGLVEQVLWNYLDNPTGLPHPSNLYWMPLPSFLIAPLFILFGISYRVAQIPFVVLSALLPLFAFYLARRVYARDDYAWAAGLLTVFSGFYTIYWVSPDNFTVYALTASLSLFFIARGIETARTRDWLAAGIFVGLSHLTRADGLLLLAIVPVVLFSQKSTRTVQTMLLFMGYCLLGYLVVMSPWFVRNTLAIGVPLPSAGTKTIWLTNYDELFRYADDLTPARYLAWGIDKIISSKASAAIQNLFILLFSSPILFLMPFILIAWRQTRRRIEFLPVAWYTLLLYFSMTLVFTFPSWRGTVFHSGAALVPYFAVLAPPGIDVAVQWLARKRRTWNVKQAVPVFRWGLIAIAAFISVYLYAGAVFSNTGNIPAWNERDREYRSISVWLEYNARPNDVVMVVDPPNFYNVAHVRAIAIPTDNVDAIFMAAKRYDARFLVLQFDHPAPLHDLYLGKTAMTGLIGVAEYRDAMNRPVKLFEIKR